MERFLLDTHAFLWLIQGDTQLIKLPRPEGAGISEESTRELS